MFQRTAMKRQQERDTPPKGKRGRANYVGHEDNGRDRLTPEVDRRESRGGKLMNREPKSHRPDRGERDNIRDRDRDYDMDPDRIPKRHREDRGMINEPYVGHISRGQERLVSPFSQGQGPEYKTLILTNVNAMVSDNVVRDLVMKEFKKFGEFNLRITHNGDNRAVYLNFRYAEDARDAKHARQNKLVLFDRPVRVDVLYNKQRQRSASPDFGVARDSFSNRSVSPPIQGGRRVMRHGNMGHDMGPGNRERNNQSGDYGGNYEHRGSQGTGRHNFPHHLQHILPEDDDKATRTLFVGNLDHVISDTDLKGIFEEYGIVEDIDIKRPAKGQGNAYAFVKFINLDMAHRAKVAMSGEYIGKFQCKIGYGKVSPSTCLWVGGVGPWIRTETLEREFDRFGAIHRIAWPQGKNYAYVLYDSIDAAQAACQEMRGFHIGGSDRRLRVDFADPLHMDQIAEGGSPRGPLFQEDRVDGFGGGPALTHSGRDGSDRGDRGGFHNDNHWHDQNRRNRGSRKDNWEGTERMDNYRNPDNPRDMDYDKFRPDDMENNGFDRRGRHRGYGGNRNYQGGRGRGGPTNQGMDRSGDQYVPQDRENRHGNNFKEFSPQNKRRRHMSPGAGGSPEVNANRAPSQEREHGDTEDSDLKDRTRQSEDRTLSRQMASVDHVDNITDLAKCLPVVWSGALVLKNSAFAARMHLVSGAVNLVDTLMRDTTTTEMPVLRITQRLRLDQPKLEEVGRRVLTCGPSGHSVLLARPGSVQALEDSNTNAQIQQRPLRNLVSYLKQKEAAGVITLPPNPSKGYDNTGVLYAFPPCQFGLEFLLKCAPKLNADASSKEDHLVVVVVRAEA